MLHVNAKTSSLVNFDQIIVPRSCYHFFGPILQFNASPDNRLNIKFESNQAAEEISVDIGFQVEDLHIQLIFL